jgi:hypothetical protein
MLATSMYNMHLKQKKVDYLYVLDILDFVDAHSKFLKPSSCMFLLPLSRDVYWMLFILLVVSLFVDLLRGYGSCYCWGVDVG